MIEVHVPPLRERREEIAQLIEFFLLKFASVYRRPAVRPSLVLQEALLRYEWPGNIRELENMMKRLVVLQDETLILAELGRLRTARAKPRPNSYTPHARPTQPPPQSSRCRGPPRGRAATAAAVADTRAGRSPHRRRRRRVPSMGADGVNLQELARHAAMGAEKEAIQQALERFRWNRRKTAEYLQVSYKTLLNKMKECGISESPSGIRRPRQPDLHRRLLPRPRFPSAGSRDRAASTDARGSRPPGLSRDPRDAHRPSTQSPECAPLPAAAQPPQQSVSIIVGQADVADQHVGRPLAGDAQAFGGGAGRLRLAAVQPENRGHRGGRIRIVFGDQDVQIDRTSARASTVRDCRGGACASGSDTVNVAPCPAPSLSAVMRPPCRSTSRLHDREAQPQAGSHRASRRPAGTARRRAAGTPGSMPSPVVRHAHDGAAALAAWRSHIDVPPRGVYFTALASRFHATCCRRCSSPITGDALVGALDVDGDLLRGGCRPDGLDGGVDDRAQVDRRHRQADAALDHPRDVEEVFDQAGLDLRVAIDRVHGVPPLLLGPSAPVCRTCTQPTIALSGVRSSCDAVARNSSFR